VAVAGAHRLVGVMTEETRQRVADAHRSRVISQAGFPAARAGTARFDEDSVIDRGPR
jgi:hypothetical protein